MPAIEERNEVTTQGRGLTGAGALLKELREQFSGLSTQQIRDLAELIKSAEGADQEARQEIAETVMEVLCPRLIGAAVPLSALGDETARRRLEQYRQKVGAEIRRFRRRAGMSQQELAEKAGLPQSHVSRLERGKHAPTYKTIGRIAKALGTRPKMLDPGFDDEDG